MRILFANCECDRILYRFPKLFGKKKRKQKSFKFQEKKKQKYKKHKIRNMKLIVVCVRVCVVNKSVDTSVFL